MFTAQIARPARILPWWLALLMVIVTPIWLLSLAAASVMHIWHFAEGAPWLKAPAVQVLLWSLVLSPPVGIALSLGGYVSRIDRLTGAGAAILLLYLPISVFVCIII